MPVYEFEFLVRDVPEYAAKSILEAVMIMVDKGGGQMAGGFHEVEEGEDGKEEA